MPPTEKLTPHERDHAFDKLDELLEHITKHSNNKQNVEQSVLCLQALRQVRKELPVLEAKAAYADAEQVLHHLYMAGKEESDPDVIRINATLEMRRREMNTIISFCKDM